MTASNGNGPTATEANAADICGIASNSASIEALRGQIAQAKQDILATLVEIDDIRLQINPALEADYAVKVGYLVNESLKAEIDAMRAKRKFALAQARANRNEEIDDDAIESRLDEEMADWESKLAAEVASLRRNMERRAGASTMSAADSRELKRLFRKLSKRLHPDINPMQSDEEAHLFLMVQMAYANGDLALMRALDTTIEDAQPRPDDEALSELELEAQLVALKAQLEQHRSELERLRQEFPYSYAEKLQNPEWLAVRTHELEEKAEGFRRMAQMYADEYEGLVRK